MALTSDKKCMKKRNGVATTQTTGGQLKCPHYTLKIVAYAIIDTFGTPSFGRG